MQLWRRRDATPSQRRLSISSQPREKINYGLLKTERAEVTPRHCLVRRMRFEFQMCCCCGLFGFERSGLELFIVVDLRSGGDSANYVLNCCLYMNTWKEISILRHFLRLYFSTTFLRRPFHSLRFCMSDVSLATALSHKTRTSKRLINRASENTILLIV